ncbi:MAG: hypothetical protein EOM65_14870 [Synergistales bacterium]|nr:hypothetical protein [Synergistales bacterium]
MVRDNSEWLQFFAEEAEESVGDSFDKQREEIRNEDFDVKSPLLGGGAYDDEEEEKSSEEIPPDGGSHGESDDSGGAEPVAAARPFRVLKADGREIPVSSEEELERLAVEGVQMGRVKDALNPYLPFLQAMQQDQQFAQKVGELMGRRGNVPTQEPSPEAEAGDDPEPEQGERESYDEYEKRLDAWRQRQQEKVIERKVQHVLGAKEREVQSQRMQETRHKLVEYVNQDPQKDSVMGVVFSKAFPQGIRDVMDRDPASFMLVYDALCMLQGRKGHFGAPLPGVGSGGESPQQRSGGRVPLKGGQAPFTERSGAASPQGGSKGIPDFKKMSDAEFDKAVSGLKQRGF